MPQARNGGVARRACARVDARQHERGVRTATGRRQDDPNRAFSGRHQRCQLLAIAERLMGRGGMRGSPAAAAGREPR
jgi:hypothetical protein